jgi:hypothetical protein
MREQTMARKRPQMTLLKAQSKWNTPNKQKIAGTAELLRSIVRMR